MLLKKHCKLLYNMFTTIFQEKMHSWHQTIIRKLKNTGKNMLSLQKLLKAIRKNIVMITLFSPAIS